MHIKLNGSCKKKTENKIVEVHEEGVIIQLDQRNNFFFATLEFHKRINSCTSSRRRKPHGVKLNAKKMYDSKNKMNALKKAVAVMATPLHYALFSQDAFLFIVATQKHFQFQSNTTSIIQPCDQSIIRTFKSYYRKEIRAQIITQIDNCDSYNANVLAKKISVLIGVHMVASYWVQVSIQTIQNCFKKGGFN
ncbi:hypothetical protein A3Q56_05119 [Intoshia linei]|uniref:DDE-1 domain-containing protein n=1 Tax=Intoshia linei TaxID=1819745 RepID=A0A177AYT1_9BILA|nr:hypothetical protein A3Q56_05119 [Intoshia linei]